LKSIAELLSFVVAVFCAIGLFLHYSSLGNDPQALATAARAAATANNEFDVTIFKKPLVREERGELVIYRYRMSGAKNYQWVVVPDDAAKARVAGLLAGSGFTAGAPGLGVETLAERSAGLRGVDRDKNAAEAAEDLRTHAAIVYSYENDPAAK
jgi:hypothetical protein